MKNLAALLLIAACSSPARPTPTMSYAAHMKEAKRHESVATEHDQLASQGERRNQTWCGDVAPGATSGGELVTHWQPCWATDRSDAAEHRELAARERADAREHRRTARNLVEVEQTFCAGMTDREIDHSPLSHFEDIALVEPYREQGTTVGARIVFRRVEGLTADWLRRAVLCHQARAAVLGVGSLWAADPVTVPLTSFAALDQGGTVVLIVRGQTDEATAEVLARSMALPRAAKTGTGAK